MNKITLLGCSALLLAPLAALHAAEPRSEVPRQSRFDDALATIVTTLEAEPSRNADRHWTPTAKGSVRLVGHIRKTSANTDGVFDILVAGKPVWCHVLNSSDTIRHGFDVAVYALDTRSQVVFRMTAKSGPAKIDMSVDILQEPHLSRWSPELATGYPKWSEATKIGLRAKGQKILQLIREASENKRGKVVIPPGDYLFHANWSQASTLGGLTNLEIVAEGVTFWFEPPMVHALLFDQCQNVTVRGLIIDFTIPCWFQARVTEVDRTAKTIRATIMAGYEPRNANGEAEAGGSRAFMFYDADGRFINHRHSPGAWQLSDDKSSLVCRDIGVSGIPATLKTGDYVVGTIRTGVALRSTNCADMRFADVNIWSSPGMAVYEGGGMGGNVYRRARATRRPDTNRLHAFGADIFHLAGADRGPTLDRCELAYGADQRTIQSEGRGVG